VELQSFTGYLVPCDKLILKGLYATGEFMERLEYDKFGGPEVVHLSSFTLPHPKENEITVRVAAASVNPMDWKIRSGQMKMFTGSRFPRGLGTDFSGIIETVGSKVANLKPGDAVLGTVSMKGSGAFAPKLITTQNLVVKKPDLLSFPDAACLPIAGVTAWIALVQKSGLKRGQRVFINGALGAVGQAAISIAHEMGAEVVGRVGPKSLTQAEALGLSLVLDYTKPLPDSINGSFDIVFDCHGSLSPEEEGRLIKHGGKVLDILPTFQKFLRAITSRSRKIIFADVGAKNLQAVVDLATAHKLKIPIVRTVSLAEASGLLEALERGERLNGKAVIVFN
jgi:NADPH:quinone reductase-like Zn-dependent oxidoreductase